MPVCYAHWAALRNFYIPSSGGEGDGRIWNTDVWVYFSGEKSGTSLHQIHQIHQLGFRIGPQSTRWKHLIRFHTKGCPESSCPILWLLPSLRGWWQISLLLRSHWWSPIVLRILQQPFRHRKILGAAGSLGLVVLIKLSRVLSELPCIGLCCSSESEVGQDSWTWCSWGEGHFKRWLKKVPTLAKQHQLRTRRYGEHGLPILGAGWCGSPWFGAGMWVV